jgi:NADPH:quinone reductase-like Zn-dependent oxidoreductase
MPWLLFKISFIIFILILRKEHNMVENMKAVRFHEYGGSENLVIETIPIPVPGRGEVLIKVSFAGVNPVDWKYRAGYLKDYMPIKLPFIPGLDVSGIIVETGPGVKSMKKGDPVFGIANGSYAEFAVASEADLSLKPGSLSFEKAAAIPIGALTAWQAVEDAGIKSGQTVIVQGAAGGVGHFAAQFARSKGARVIGVASAANGEFVRSLGVVFVDYVQGPLEDRIEKADAVIDTVGGETLEKSYGLLKKGGILVTIAGQVSEKKAEEYGVKVLRSGRGAAKDLKTIGEMAASKSLIVETGKIFPLSEAGAAQERSQTGHGSGRILLKI